MFTFNDKHLAKYVNNDITWSPWSTLSNCWVHLNARISLQFGQFSY